MLKDLKWEETQVVERSWQKVLLRAADLLEQKGWCQGWYQHVDGSFCAVGAIQYVARHIEPANSRRFAIEAEKALRRQIKGHPVTLWNDRKCRCVEEVTTAMRAAARAGE